MNLYKKILLLGYIFLLTSVCSSPTLSNIFTLFITLKKVSDRSCISGFVQNNKSLYLYGDDFIVVELCSFVFPSKISCMSKNNHSLVESPCSVMLRNLAESVGKLQQQIQQRCEFDLSKQQHDICVFRRRRCLCIRFLSI